MSDYPASKFAVSIVSRLRQAGHLAYLAGGCVRDQLMGTPPKDFDVATSARPDQVRDLFGRRRTLAVGEAFGVVIVVGPPETGNIEVATFRSDGPYLDGRHPATVTFSDPEADARRRDFTINGLFFDPLSDQLIDYVGGSEDIQRRVVRAIGDPSLRIAEDNLRMLRAIRFAVTLDFQIDPRTLAAIQQHAAGLRGVSGERIGGELRRMLIQPYLARTLTLLDESGLLVQVLPEWREGDRDRVAWADLLHSSQGLQSTRFETCLSLLIWAGIASQRSLEGPPDREPWDMPRREAWVRAVTRRWRLTRDEAKRTGWLLDQLPLILRARDAPWPQVQRVLTGDDAAELLALANAIVGTRPGHPAADHLEFGRRKLLLPRNELDPPWLLTGKDLRQRGFSQGPVLGRVLAEVRDAQLEDRIQTSDQAWQLALSLRARYESTRPT